MIDVPLNSEVMEQLALEAQLRGMMIGELVTEVIVAETSLKRCWENEPKNCSHAKLAASPLL